MLVLSYFNRGKGHFDVDFQPISKYIKPKAFMKSDLIDHYCKYIKFI